MAVVAQERRRRHAADRRLRQSRGGPSVVRVGVWANIAHYTINCELELSKLSPYSKMESYREVDRTIRRLNLSQSDLVMDIAHVESATPLHFAARQGNYELVNWLLLNGAEASLNLKNRMGCTPIDIARVCGPHHEVGGLIGSAMCVESVGSVDLQPSTTRQHRPSDELALRAARSGQTAVSMQYEMWLMPVAEMLKLSELRPHQELRAAGKLVRWNASMRGVFFLSHQWTAFTRPDHSTAQLRTVQRLLTRMLQGELPTTAPSLLDALRFPSQKVKVTSREWKELAPHAYVWMDYISVSDGG